ncbi:MAG: MFS transporter [Rhodospirillales bacterium]|nr:MFS transporter [Rhodospirillales bacterium]MDE2199616.1 MFS transporter [Rhodospirillales bacterium]
MEHRRSALGTLVALTIARIAFGYQVQTVASLGPELVRAFHMGFTLLGTLVGLYMLPGVVSAIPAGVLARRLGDRRVVTAGLALMTIGSVLSALGGGPAGIGAGRILSGAGAVALTVLQGKIVAERYSGKSFTLAMGLMVGAFPVGIGIAQLTQAPLAHAFAWPAAFLAGAAISAVALLVFATTWTGAAHPPGMRLLVWPTRRECVLVLVSGLIWTSYNSGFANFLAYMPSWLAAHGHPRWVGDVVLPLATWSNLPSIMLGSALATRFGPTPVFVFGTLMGVVAVGGVGLVDAPLLWGALFGVFASIQGGLIVEIGTLSARPENRAVGMGLFYTTYYVGGATIPALCGRAADYMGDPSGAFLAAAGISILALPFYWLHRRRARII